MSIKIQYVKHSCKYFNSNCYSVCDDCQCDLVSNQDFFIVYWNGPAENVYLCPACLYKLSLIISPLQVLLTTGINIKK